MNGIYLVLFVVVNICSCVLSQNVMGCGGFVKSHISIDFSRVEIKLLTTHGILKDKINCAPTGYYFMPVYDKGDYILELEPPAGWSFQPTKVELTIDGNSDLCSKGQDINFVFKGFGITGKVQSFGSADGPEGVEVELFSDTQPARRTKTGANGSFFFTPVYPGDYKLSIVNSQWNVIVGQVNVKVHEENMELKANSLLIQGYDVSGAVTIDGSPIKDTVILIFAENPNARLDGCDKQAVFALKLSEKPQCLVKTDAKGIFKFATVPNGKYYVTPYYNGQNIYFEPNKIEFQVKHNSVKLNKSFEIVGFAASGKVLNSYNGRPISKAKIYLNDKEMGETTADGIYKLEKLKVGTYRVKAQADNYLFNEITVDLNPTTKEIQTLIPSAYKYCGQVISDKFHQITFQKLGSTKIINVISNADNGEFCEYLSPARYNVQVTVDNNEKTNGLQFFPHVVNLEVSGDQKEAIIFSQLKATVVGKVECIKEKYCEKLQLVMRLKSDRSNSNKDLIISLNQGLSYKISDVNPGIYDISLSESQLCWQSATQTINVNSAHIVVPTFIQIGFNVKFVATHSAQVVFKYPGQEKQEEHFIEIEGTKPINYCLKQSGIYTFTVKSCHSYESNSLIYNTESPDATNELILTAIKHTIKLKIAADRNDVSHVGAIVTINNGQRQTMSNLPYTRSPQGGKGGYYNIELLLSPSETAIILPQSDVLVFKPSQLTIGGSEDCKDLGVKFHGILGVVYKGKIIPPLAGVEISVEADNFVTLTMETDDRGAYQFPPLDQEKTYRINAKKDSYVLVGPNQDGNFLAHKLAEIVIQVIDGADNAPLQGCLLSLSGGDSYRSNLQTNAKGKITFHSLSPGEYFLRPMMKEYNFEPTSKLIKVKEGQTINVQLMGKRVAYSAYGLVTSLNREPEENIVVIAVGNGNCSHFSEESLSEANGQFRIRGLQPWCSYDVIIKNSQSDSQLSIERSAPKQIHLDAIVKDVHALHLIVFRSVPNTDVLVKVHAKNIEHYKSLRLKVIRESVPSAIVYNARLDTNQILLLTNENNNGVLVQIPAIPLDNKSYSIYLESNLNNKRQPQPESFTANTSVQYFQFEFVVKTNVADQDIKQTSMWTLLFIFIFILAIYNTDKFGQLIQDKIGGRIADLLMSSTNSKKNQVTVDYHVDNDDIDQIVQSINAVKRKPKAKKL